MTDVESIDCLLRQLFYRNHNDIEPTAEDFDRLAAILLACGLPRSATPTDTANARKLKQERGRADDREKNVQVLRSRFDWTNATWPKRRLAETLGCR